MRKSDLIKTALQMFLFEISEAGAALLLRELRREAMDDAVFFASVLDADEDRLRVLLSAPGNVEDKFFYVNTFLWKQKLAQIEKNSRIQFNVEACSDLWLIHRYMAELKYEDLGKTHIPVIQKYISIYKDRCGYTDDDYFSMVCMHLNAIGTQVLDSAMLTEVVEFLDYILDNYDQDQRIQWLGLVHFMALVVDLKPPKVRSWPICTKFLSRGYQSIYDYLAWLWAIREFGPQAEQVLRRMSVIGGFSLLRDLALS
jgi:hypothetical protein